MHQVNGAVADVGRNNVIAVKADSRHGGAHSLKVIVSPSMFEDHPVGEMDAGKHLVAIHHA